MLRKTGKSFEMEVKNQTRKVTKVLARKISHQNLREVQKLYLTRSKKTLQDLGENSCVRIIFRKDGIAGKGTFGLVQKVKILKITSVDSDSTENSGKKRIYFFLSQ